MNCELHVLAEAAAETLRRREASKSLSVCCIDVSGMGASQIERVRLGLPADPPTSELGDAEA